jgi:hypothetical protein
MPPCRDRFGVAMLVPSVPGGRAWCASWDDGRPRAIDAVNWDRSDAQFEVRGRGCLRIDGAGVGRLAGDAPRMYVRDRTETLTWGDVEITFYGCRRGDRADPNATGSQGFVAGARSDHHCYASDPCAGRGYYGRMLYTGRIDVKKELLHDAAGGVYTSPRPNARTYADWGTADHGVPLDEWVGYKFVVQTTRDGRGVRLRLFRDRTGGAGGGTWERLIDETDAGGWSAPVGGRCPGPDDRVLFDPGRAVFVRNDAVAAADYKWFSVREVVR